MSVTIVRHRAGAKAGDENKRYFFFYGDQRIQFVKTVRETGSQRLLIKVHPDGQVEVLAPIGASDATLVNAVKKRGRWIYKQLQQFHAQRQHVTPRLFVSGESHYYLGRQYVLKVIEAADDAQYAKLLRGRFEVAAQQKSKDSVKQLLNAWFKERAKEVFSTRLDAMLEQTLWVPERPPLRVLTMKTQWGSCSPNGRLTLNPHLVKAPRECIDYVLLHELCHIAEHNHSARFHRLMHQVMPEWEKTKTKLDGMANQILIGS